MGRFKKLDRDGDKTLSRKEIRKGLKVLEQGTGFSVKEVAGKKAKAVFGALDGGGDGDGQVDAEEFFAFVNTAQERAASDALFKQLDGKKGDGMLSRKEIEKGLAGGTIPAGSIGVAIKAKEVLDAAEVAGGELGGRGKKAGGKLDKAEFFALLVQNEAHEARREGFKVGDVAVWLKSDEETPDGSQGVVLGEAANSKGPGESPKTLGNQSSHWTLGPSQGALKAWKPFRGSEPLPCRHLNLTGAIAPGPTRRGL